MFLKTHTTPILKNKLEGYTLPILSIHMKFINRPNDLRDLIRYSANAVKSSLDIH